MKLTYQREDDNDSDNVNNAPFGLHLFEGDNIVETEWFTSEEEREEAIKELREKGEAEHDN